MIRTTFALALLSCGASAACAPQGTAQPPQPGWQTDAANCSWKWREGGGIGLWTEECRFNNGKWRVIWDKRRSAFVIRNGKTDMGIAVQPFALSEASDLTIVSQRLVETGYLKADAECSWQTAVVRSAPRTMAFHVLAPVHPDAHAPTAQKEVPEPICGPYGTSTHGVRYFMTDLRWPSLAVFVEEGQERPLFDPASIIVLPKQHHWRPF